MGVTDNSLSEKTVTSWICTSSTTADMNGKCILALILTLQVSMSLCDSPPTADLVQRYNDVRTRFYNRLMHAMNTVQAALLPYAESEQGAAVKSVITELSRYEEHLRPYVGAFLNDFITQATPILDKYF